MNCDICDRPLTENCACITLLAVEPYIHRTKLDEPTKVCHTRGARNGQEDNVAETRTETEAWEDRISRERREEIAEERAALVPLKGAAGVLGAKIGGTWTVTLKDAPNRDWPDRRDIEVLATQDIGGGFLPLTFEADYNRQSKRVVLRVKLPTGVEWRHTGREPRPEATFDRVRGAVGFATSLKRILDASRIYVTSAVESQERESAAVSKTTANITRIAKALGVRVPEYQSPTDERRLYAHPASIGSLDAKVWDDNVTIALSGVPIALAEKLLKLIADAKPKKGE